MIKRSVYHVDTHTMQRCNMMTSTRYYGTAPWTNQLSSGFFDRTINFCRTSWGQEPIGRQKITVGEYDLPEKLNPLQHSSIRRSPVVQPVGNLNLQQAGAFLSSMAVLMWGRLLFRKRSTGSTDTRCTAIMHNLSHSGESQNLAKLPKPLVSRQFCGK